MAYIVFDEGAMSRLTKSPSGMVGQWMDRKGSRLVGYAKAQVGVDTGDLRRSISHRTTGRAYGILTTVSAKDRKAMMHHEGTRAHRIEPRRQKTLRFSVGGRTVYAKQIWHPGTKPNRYLTDNLPRVL